MNLQIILRIVRVGGCPAVVVQWQSTKSEVSWVPLLATAGLFTFLDQSGDPLQNLHVASDHTHTESSAGSRGGSMAVS